MYVSSGVTTWQGEINFVLYENELKPPRFVRTIVRDNRLIVTSISRKRSYDIRGFPSLQNPIEPSWFRELFTNGDAIQYDAEWNRWQFWVFLTVANRRVTVIERYDPSLPSESVDFSFARNGKFRINPTLAIWLRAPEKPMLPDGPMSVSRDFRYRGEAAPFQEVAGRQPTDGQP